MDYTEIRKLSLKSFIGFLALTALIAIICVLIGKFGEFQFKILATSFTISATSILSMACAVFIEKKRHVKLGISGISLSVVSAILVIVGIWLGIESEGYWKPAITFGTAAVAFTYAFLLVLPELDDRQKWVQQVSSIFIGILALQIIVAVWGEIDNEVYYRFLAVVAIIVGLKTLSIPMLMKLHKGNIQRREKLLLEKIENGVYMDPAGKKYELREINTEQDG